MARIRTIKPSFFTSFAMVEFPLSTRLTFIGLWTYVDDEGRGADDPRLVKAAIWPLDDDMSARKVENELRRLADGGQIMRYEVCGRRYLQVTNWGEHQRINRKTPSAIPAPLTDLYDIPHGGLTAPSVNDPDPFAETSPTEGNREQGMEVEEGYPPTPLPDLPVENVPA